MLFRTYVTKLEGISEENSINKKRINLLEQDTKVLDARNKNLEEQLSLTRGTIKTLEEKVTTQEDQFKIDIKKAKKKARKSGFYLGGIGGILICLLLM